MNFYRLAALLGLSFLLVGTIPAVDLTPHQRALRDTETLLIQSVGYVGEFSVVFRESKGDILINPQDITRLPLADDLAPEGNCDDAESANDAAEADGTCDNNGGLNEDATEVFEYEDGSKSAWGRCNDGNLWGRLCAETITDECDPIGNLPSVNLSCRQMRDVCDGMNCQ